MTYLAASALEARRAATDRLRQAECRSSVSKPAQDDPGRKIELRQRRHHAANTLQRIIALITEIPGLAHTLEGEKSPANSDTVSHCRPRFPTLCSA